MSEEILGQTTNSLQPLVASQSPMPTHARFTDSLQNEFLRAGEMSEAEKELQDLQDTFGYDFLKQMFPEEYRNVKLGTMEEQCQKLKKAMSETIMAFFGNPYHPASEAAVNMTNMLEAGLASSMIGPVIERLPDYTPFLPLVLMQTGPKDFHDIESGLDTLEFEHPIDRGVAYNYNPSGDGAQVVDIVGGRTEINAYFKETPRHVLRFWEWGRRQIKPIIVKKRHLMQELARGWDEDLVIHFDALVPDDTLYSAHNAHSVPIQNSTDAVTIGVFREAARYLRHTDAATGTEHIAPPGFALCDPLAIDDMENWGTDVWKEATVEDMARYGFGQLYDETLIIGKRVQNFMLLQTPLQIAGNGRHVRFFAKKEKVGYFIPVTVNGKRVRVQIGPMAGNDPDFLAVRNVTTPPGYTFAMQASTGGAIQIINPYALSEITHT